MRTNSDFEIYLRTGGGRFSRDLQNSSSIPGTIRTTAVHFCRAGNYVPGGNSGGGPLSGVTPIEKQRAAQINRFAASKNAKARVPITDSVTLHLEKRGGSVSGKFTKKGVPGSLRFTATIGVVKGKREIRIVGMKWSGALVDIKSEPEAMRIFSNSQGLYSQINRHLTVEFLGQTIVNEGPRPQRLNRTVK